MTLIARPSALSATRKPASSSPTASSIPSGLSDPSRRLEGAEPLRPDRVLLRSEHPVPQLGVRDDADRDLIRQLPERPSLLASDEDRGVQQRAHARSDLFRRSGKARPTRSRAPVGLCSRDETLPAPARPGRGFLDRYQIGGIAPGDGDPQPLPRHDAAKDARDVVTEFTLGMRPCQHRSRTATRRRRDRWNGHGRKLVLAWRSGRVAEGGAR